MKDIFTKVEIEVEKIKISKETLNYWQHLLEMMLDFTSSQDALINKYTAPYLKVEKASCQENNFFSEGDKFKIEGLYCQEVIDQKSSIKVNNAAEIPKWQDSIYMDNGLIAYLGFPILWPNGEIYGTICIHDNKERSFSSKTKKIIELVRNIIENNLEVIYRNQINSNLRRYYSQLYNLLPVGVTIEDKKGNIIWVNNKIVEISGFKREDLIGNNILDTLVLKKNREKAKENIKKILAGNTLTHKAISATAEGEKIYLKLREKKIKLPNEEYGIVSIQSDISDTIKAQEKIKYESCHDSLTTLYNRSYIENKIRNLDFDQNFPVALIMLDINGLKLINDTYGHHNGDLLLKKVAEILGKNCRSEDIVARWGGDEFVILLPQTSKKAVVKIMERIKLQIKNSFIKLKEKNELPISAALGYSVNNKYQDIYNSLAQAEEMMYKNKLISSGDFKKEIIEKMFESLNKKSSENKRHSNRMSKFAKMLAEAINLTEAEVEKAVLTAELHDLGKVVISENILNKKGKLNEAEWRKIKEHPAVGHRILNASKEFAHISEEVLSHHERWDGKGYPRALKKEEIPLIARIIAVVDTYEVLTSDQPYKKALSSQEALREIAKNAGSQFDPHLAEIFIELISKQKD